MWGAGIRRALAVLAVLAAGICIAQTGQSAQREKAHKTDKTEKAEKANQWLQDLPSMQPEPDVPEPDVAAARKAVYGGATWRDARAASFFGRESALQVHEVFRVRYRELERNKLMLVYQLTPGPREQFACHSCVPVLGAAVMAQGPGGAWLVQARGEALMTGAPFSGPEDLQMLQLSPGRWALRSRQSDVVQGLESRRERLVLQQQDRLLLVLDEGFSGKPGPQACGPGTAPQNTAIQPLSGSDEAPRLELILRYNEGGCPAPLARVERRRFELRDGRFASETGPQ